MDYIIDHETLAVHCHWVEWNKDEKVCGLLNNDTKCIEGKCPVLTGRERDERS